MRWILALALLALFASARPAAAQVLFSIDYQSPTVSIIDPSTGLPITHGDILGPFPGAPGPGPLPSPRILIRGSDLGLSQYPACSGAPAGTPCGIEVDAISQGKDERFVNEFDPFSRVWFSVDEYAVGLGPFFTGHPQVVTEKTHGESSTDLFLDTGLPPGPVPPFAVVPHNVGAIDGNGLLSPSGFVYPGLGLKEPNPPSTALPNPGDNVDAFDIDSPTVFPVGGVYFSLDAGFPDPHPLAGQPATNSAVLQGFRGADVLRTPTATAAPILYAPALILGLDRDGPGTDDLDALILWENGDGFFQPSLVPYDWTTGQRDMLMFSVRRGSRVIGKLDSIFGIPIEAGDILTTPRAGSPSPYPGIFIAAENLGLATERSAPFPQFGDDIDALDHSRKPIFDCNKNGVDDAVDIATGYSMDANMNGIPDECESDLMLYCFCPDPFAPCDNPDPNAGCRNSSTVGARLDVAGTTSVSADDLVITFSALPVNKSGLLFMSVDGKPPVPFGDGGKCPFGATFRFWAQNSGATGTMLYANLVSYANSHFPPAGQIDAGDTWHMQGWFRDPPGPCGLGTNLTNAVRVIFSP